MDAATMDRKKKQMGALVQIAYINRRGAHVIETVHDADRLESRIRTLCAQRRSATAMAGEYECGAVWKNEGRWTWFVDRGVFE